MEYQILRPIWVKSDSFRAGIRDTVIKNAIRNKESLLVWFRDGDKIKISHINKPKAILKNGQLEEMYRKFDEPMKIYHFSFAISEIKSIEEWENRKLMSAIS